MYLEFKDELLIPQINGEIYFQIYEIENWLRRICLTAYMIQFGTSWVQLHESTKSAIYKI